MKLAAEVGIDCPIEQVFDCWAALERSPEHQKPTIDRTRLTDGPISVGTRYSATDQWPGRKVQFEMEITAYERPFRISARWDEPMNGSWEALLRSEGAGTVMEFVTTIEPSGLMGLLAPLMKPWAVRQMDQGLSSFKEWVEAGAC